MKPIVAPMATMNSAMLTVPMTWFGASWLAAIIVEVVTGPQPPPPIESTKPPTAPSGPRLRQRGRYRRMTGDRPKTVRTRTMTPSTARTSETHGAATSPAMLLSTMAPMKAPTAPGSASMTTARQWTLPKRQCAVPDIRPVPILTTWIDADAAAGAKPTAASSVAVVTPKPMPSEPSTSWAKKPMRATTARPPREVTA